MMGNCEMHHFDAKAGVQPIHLQSEHAFEMPTVAGGPGRTDGKVLSFTIHAVSLQAHDSCTKATGLQKNYEIIDKVAYHLCDALRSADWFEQSERDDRSLRRHHWDNRLSKAPASLVEALDRPQPKATRQRPAWHRVKISDPLQSEARRRKQRLGGKAKCSQRHVRNRLGFPSRF